MSQLAEIATNGTVGESEKVEGASAQSVPDEVDKVSCEESGKQDTQESPQGHGEDTVAEKIDTAEYAQEKEKEEDKKEDAANDEKCATTACWSERAGGGSPVVATAAAASTSAIFTECSARSPSASSRARPNDSYLPLDQN